MERRRGASTEPESHLGSLFPIIQALQPDHGPELSPSEHDFAAWEDWRRRAREALERHLSYAPPECPFDAAVIESVDCDGYTRKLIHFSTAPYMRVPAYLLVPDTKGPHPGVLALHDHAGFFYFGKEKLVDLKPEHPALVQLKERLYEGRSIADELARRGYVVLVIDEFYWGDRRPTFKHPPAELLHAIKGLDPEDAEYVHRVNRFLHGRIRSLKTMLEYAGTTWLGIVAHDDRLSLEFLKSLPEVDAERVGAVGLSGGGHRATYLVGTATGLKAACIVGWMTTLRSVPAIHQPVHADIPVGAGLYRCLDHPDVACVGAPECALFVQNCEQDALFTYDGMQDAARKIEDVYRGLGASERFQYRFYDVPHRFDVAMQADAFAWLDRWLKS